MLVGLAAVALVIGGALGIAAVPGGKQSGGNGASRPAQTHPTVINQTPTTVATVTTRRPVSVQTPKQPVVHPSHAGRGHVKNDDQQDDKPRGKAKGHDRD